MVRVVYQPPPFGPATNLTSGAYGPGVTTPWLIRLSKMPPGRVIGGSIAAVFTICAIPQLCEFHFLFIVYARRRFGGWLRGLIPMLTRDICDGFCC